MQKVFITKTVQTLFWTELVHINMSLKWWDDADIKHIIDSSRDTEQKLMGEGGGLFLFILGIPFVI